MATLTFSFEKNNGVRVFPSQAVREFQFSVRCLMKLVDSHIVETSWSTCRDRKTSGRQKAGETPSSRATIPSASVPPSPRCLCFCCLSPWWRWRMTAGGRINRRRMARHLLPALHQLLLKHDELASSSEHVELPRMLVFHSVTFVFVGFLLWTSSRLLFLVSDCSGALTQHCCFSG